MDENYFDYLIEEVSVFSPDRTIGSIKRHFRGYPFDEKSKEIISKVAEKRQVTEENKLKLEELTEKQKKVSVIKEFKTGQLSQELLKNTSTWPVFIICSIIIFLFFFSLLTNSAGILSIFFFLLNCSASLITAIYVSGRKFPVKVDGLHVFLSLIAFLGTFILSFYMFPHDNYWRAQIVSSLLPFLLFPLSSLLAKGVFEVIKIIMKMLHRVEMTAKKKRNFKKNRELKEKRKEIEKQVHIIDREIREIHNKLTDKQMDFVKDLAEKHQHIFFPFNEIETEYDLLHGNLMIAIGEYRTGLELIKKNLSEKIETFPAYHFWQGVIETEEGMLDKASLSFNRCINLLPQSVDPYLSLSFTYMKNNNLDLLEAMMKTEPVFSFDNSEKFFLKGLLLFLQENWDRSELELQKSLSFNQDNNSVKIILLLLFLKTKQYKKLFSMIKTVKDNYLLCEMFLGVAEYNQKNYKNAVNHFNNILRQDDEHIEALCFRELSKAHIKTFSLFKEKNMAQKFISRLSGDIEHYSIVCYTTGKLYQIEGYNEEALSYLEKAYKIEPSHTLILGDLARFYLNSPYENLLAIEVLLKAIPLLEGKKRILKRLLNFLLFQPDIPDSIIKLLEEQYFKNINYDPLLVQLLAKYHLKRNTMSEKATEIYLKALELNCLDEKQKASCIKLISWNDAETGNFNEARIAIYKNLLGEYPDDERIMFLNSAIVYRENDMIKENPELFKNLLQKKYISSRFWEIFKLNRDFILLSLVKYLYEHKIYNEDTMKLIQESSDMFPRDRHVLLTFGEASEKLGATGEKALRAYKSIYREEPDNIENLVALGRAYLACNEIHADTINVLEQIFTKGLFWDEAIKVMTDYYLQKMSDGNLVKNIIVLSVWGHYTKIVPKDYKVRFYIAEEFFAQKEYIHACEEYEEVVSGCPSNRDAMFRLGECYIEMGKIEKSIEIFKRILNIKRDDLPVLEKLGTLYLSIYKNDEEAIVYYEKAHEADRKNIEYLKILLELYKKKSDPSNMIRIQEKITSLERTGKNLATLGNFYLKTNRIKEGISCMGEAIKKEFHADGRVHLMLAEAKYFMLNDRSSRRDWEELIDILSLSIKLGCRDKKIYEIRYQVYLKIGDKKKAAEDRKIFAPDDLDNLYQLAGENETHEDVNSVKENLMQIYRRDKDFLDVSLKLAKIYSKEGTFDKKHIDIILHSFYNRTSQFLHNDEDNRMILHIHNYFKSHNLFSEEIEFLKNLFHLEHPYNEGKLKGWLAIAFLEINEFSRASEVLNEIDINLDRDVLLDANMRLAEEFLFKEQFTEAEAILEKIYLTDPAFKNAGTLLENLRLERLGRFALLEPIGSGANATVYKAFDLVMRNYVALKCLHKDLYNDREALNNFKKEYEILSELIHPGIAKVIPGSFREKFFAVELLDKTLSLVLEKNKDGLELNEFFHIVTQIVEALHYMHSKNIIYHDLAPDNVMFAGDIVKFCDLGGAKRFDLKSRQTIVGSTEKHYLYASPEQCRHEFDPSARVDQRSDIYSLGVLMYHMICGIPPFIGPDQALLSAHQHSIPSPLLLQKDNISRQLVSIILKALEKDPDRRQQSMEELLQEIMQTPRG
jgi:tetratricopeptide (TPR) repeat protein